LFCGPSESTVPVPDDDNNLAGWRMSGKTCGRKTYLLQDKSVPVPLFSACST
jgi:hypothetical protein